MSQNQDCTALYISSCNKKRTKKNYYESAVTEVFESFLKSQSQGDSVCSLQKLNSCFERTKLKHYTCQSHYT